MPLRYSCLRVFSFACALLGLAGCVGLNRAPTQSVLSGDRVDLPTSESNGLLFVDVRLNGAGPYRLAVDTGSTCVCVAADVARAAGLKPTAVGDEIHTPVGSISGTFVRVETLESGGMRLEGLNVTVLDPSAIDALRRISRRFDGVIGMSAFKDVVLLLDFPRRQVSVARLGESAYPAAASAKFAGHPAFYPRVTIKVCGKPVPAMIDTGSAFGLIVPDLDTYPLVHPVIKDDGVGGFAVGSAVGRRGENSQVDGVVQLGPVSWTNPPVRWQRDGPMANIGVQVLNHWTLAIDQHAHRIYFMGPGLNRTWPREQPSELRYRLGYLANLEGTGLRLIEVDEGAAFSIGGLRAGDLILTVNRVPAAEFALRYHPTAARKIVVRYSRAGEIMSTTIRLKPAQLPK